MKQSKELQTAQYDDWKRKVVDDAKKRAVAQAGQTLHVTTSKGKVLYVEIIKAF